jgi:superfamily II DNA or RNA helicase
MLDSQCRSQKILRSTPPRIGVRGRLVYPGQATGSGQQKNVSAGKQLVTGGTEDQFLPHLRSSILRANRIDIAVAFTKSSGLSLIFDSLHEALVSGEPAAIRFLTSDYLGVTDPEALRDLLVLSEYGMDVRLYQSGDQGFHLKAYLFAFSTPHGESSAWAFVGSSNLTAPALTASLEWNYRIERDESPSGILEAQTAFEELWDSHRANAVSDQTVDEYARRRVAPTLRIAPGSDDAEEGAPTPRPVQTQALAELAMTRQAGYKSALVVMATGLGKTHLAAFDAAQFDARTVLFVAHREEILAQAHKVFQRVFPNARLGAYTRVKRDTKADMLFASVQTLSRLNHLERFEHDHFDYIIVDEFHHAQAPTYRRLIAKFRPRFLLGLTATPDRTDGADIRALCDENVVFSYSLFDAVREGYLCPFSYYGIRDASVDYEEIPWRNGKFDPQELENKLATIKRAEHVYKEWAAKRQERTLAFCVSKRHADFMAERFNRRGVAAAAVYGGSELDRAQALELLKLGEIEVIFSVDLFSEGVDLPTIDTIMMLRPTESRILFLQQLGRGLRRHHEKELLVVLDFIGNHKSFLTKPQALFGIEPTSNDVLRFVTDYENGDLALPPGCFVNFDLEVISFLKSLHTGAPRADYELLRDSLQRRPTAGEYYRSGSSMRAVVNEHGSWFSLVNEMGDLVPSEQAAFERHKLFLAELGSTRMSRSFKMVLVEAFLALDGFRAAPTIDQICQASREVFQRKRWLIPDLRQDVREVDSVKPRLFREYWKANPINAWTGGNLPAGSKHWFDVHDATFRFAETVRPADAQALSDMVRELIEFRLAEYAGRTASPIGEPSQIAAEPAASYGAESRRDVLYFPDIPVACGHFRSGSTGVDEFRQVRAPEDKPDEMYFVARATGDSMSHGERPVRDGDYLLLSYGPTKTEVVESGIYVIERTVEPEPEYVLRQVERKEDGTLVLVASNPAFEDIRMTDDMRAIARLVRVLGPLEFSVGKSFTRPEVPALFGEEFNPGNWNSGHISLPGKNAIVLFVTLNKQGKASQHRYADRWIDSRTLNWQSQNSTTPVSKKGQEIINHKRRGMAVHLFLRNRRLNSAGKGAPFTYYGRVEYESHSGSGPVDVRFKLVD